MAVWDSAEQTVRSSSSHPWVAEAFSALDLWLRRRQAVFEYTDNPACVFRIDVNHSPRALVLRDGTRVRAGQRIIQLHFWNEQIPLMPKDGPTIGWARQMQRAMVTSLRELARFLAARPDLRDITVISGQAPSGTRVQREQLGRIMARYGFEVLAEPEHLTLAERLHRFGENILISLIVLGRNASALRFDTLARVRLPIYLSRRVLEKEFGEAEKEFGQVD